MATGAADSEARSILGVARVGGALALALGAVVLIGWASGLDPLVRISPSFASMVPNTAVMFVCCGAVVLLEAVAAASPGVRALRLALLVLMLAIVAVTLFEHLIATATTGGLLFSADETTDAREMLPSPQTAIAFLLLGIAIASARSGVRWVEILCSTALVLVLTIVSAELLGYLIGVDSLHRPGEITGVALHTATGLGVLCVSVFALRPDHRPGSWYAHGGAGDLAARRAMPIGLAVPVLSALLADYGFDQGWWGTGFALVLTGLTTLAAIQFLFVVGASQVNRDVALRLRAEEDAREQALRALEAEERFRSAFDNAPIGLALVGLDGTWIQVNRALCEMTGYAEHELLARNFQEITHPDDLEVDLSLMQQTLADEIRTYETEKRLLHADGTTISALLSVSLVRDAEGEPRYFVSQVQDITERKRQEQELLFLSSHDVLTGLANRREFSADMRRRIAESDRYGRAFAVVLLDLDHFKYINDSLGHGVGDRVLRNVAEVLRRRLRETDAVARLGGDEFACVLAGADEVTGVRIAGELLEAVRGLRVAAAGSRELRISASAGVVCTGQLEPETEETLLAAADLAMYAAKDAGRDSVVLYDATAGSRSQASLRVRWSHRIRAALDEGRFRLHFQPIVDLHDPKLRMFEALLRLYDQPNGLPVLPGEFLYIADRYGMMPAIDRWVAQAVIETIASGTLPDGCTVALNVSARSLSGTGLLDGVERQLERTGVDACRLVFEVTESTAFSKLDDARHFARRVKRIGAAMALDDFGTGFGSLTHLKYLPSAFIKIDGEFIAGVADNVQDRSVVEALVHVARKTDRRTIAEHVRDAKTLSIVTELGVDMAQGFHIGRPVPPADLEAVPAQPT